MPRALVAGSSLGAGPALLGARLVREDGAGLRIGRIVELEAYVGVEDRASHARFGRTARNAVMFGPPGHAYVYLVYGMYDCLNIVTEPEGRPAALLVRAVEPLAGLDQMREARAERLAARLERAGRSAAAVEERLALERRRLRGLDADRLAAGPGLVCAAFSIDRRDSGRDLCDPASTLRLEPAPADEARPATGTSERIGIAYADEPWRSNQWRFFVADSRAVSTVPAARLARADGRRADGRRADAPRGRR